MMPNKVTLLLLALFLALPAWWSSDAHPSVDIAQAAVEEYVVLLQRSLDMQDTSDSSAATDISQELQRKQQDMSASVAAANTSQSKQQQRQQQQQHDNHLAAKMEQELQALTAKMELAAATSGAHSGKEEVFPSLPPSEEQDRDYVRDESDAQASARRKKEAARQASQEATQEDGKERLLDKLRRKLLRKKQAAKKDKQASEPAPAPQPLPVTAPEPGLEDANYVEHQDNVKVVPVGTVLNFNEKLQEDQEKFRQAEKEESSSLVKRLRLELDLEHARQEAEEAQRATAEQQGVYEVANAQFSAVASDAEKAAELHKLAFEVYNKTLNGTYEERENTQNMSAEEKGTRAGELRAAAGPGSNLAVVPLLIVSWAAVVAF